MCANVQGSLFPQQKLDDIEGLGLEDTPDKSKKKKKRRPSKSDVSSDSDAYPGTPAMQASDSDTSLMDVDVNEDLPMPILKAKNKVKIKYRKQREDEDDLLCGLCNTRHGKGICYMTEDSTNLLEYREMLMNHDSEEPLPVRVWTSPHIVLSRS